MSTIYFFVDIFIKGHPVVIVSYDLDLPSQPLVSVTLGLALTKSVERSLPGLLRR